MSETNIPNPENISHSNRELLIDEGGVLGPVLASYYDATIAYDPLVADAKIIRLLPQNTLTANARYRDKTESGLFEVGIMLGDMTYALARKDQERQSIPVYDTMLAQRLGIGVEEVTPQLAYVHDFLHEFVHIGQYTRAADLNALRAHNKQQRETMPLGDRRVSRLLTSGTDEQKYLSQNRAELLERYGAKTIDDLINLQFVAYRNLDSEKDADNGAARILLSNQELFATLLCSGSIQGMLDASQVSFDEEF